MKEKKERNSKFYLIIGLSLCVVAVIIFICLLIFSYVYPLNDISKDWYLFLILGVGLVIFIVGYIVLRKSNKVRIKEQEIEEGKINDLIKEKFKQFDNDDKE